MKKSDVDLILFGLALLATAIIGSFQASVEKRLPTEQIPSDLSDENLPRPLLEKLLKRMVEKEDYEAAAMIRDELNRA